MLEPNCDESLRNAVARRGELSRDEVARDDEVSRDEVARDASDSYRCDSWNDDGDDDEVGR